MKELRAALTERAVHYFLEKMGLQEKGAAKGRLYGMPYIRFAWEEKELFQYLFMRRNAFEELRTARFHIVKDIGVIQSILPIKR